MSIKSFIQLICVLAAVASVMLWGVAPPPSDYSVGTVGVLAALALTAELMVFLLPRGATGSISFITYMTAVLLVPNFAALAAIGLANAIAEIAKRRGVIKFAFNTAQLIVTYAIAIAVYRQLGGVTLLALTHTSAADATLKIGIPLIDAYGIVVTFYTMLGQSTTSTLQSLRSRSAWPPRSGQ